MKIDGSLIKALADLNIDFRLLSVNCTMLEEDIKIGKEGRGNIIRLCENSMNPLDIYLTTKNKYRVYDKTGTQIFYIDKVYVTERDFINFLRKY